MGTETPAASVMTSAGVVLGQPTELVQHEDLGIGLPALLTFLGTDYGIWMIASVKIMSVPSVTPGYCSTPYRTNDTMGMLIRFIGKGVGHLLAAPAADWLHIGEVRGSSWAYLPPCMSFYFVVNPNSGGNLHFDSVALQPNG